MTLEVAERAVVAHDLKAVVRALEGASRTVAAVAAFAHVACKQRARDRRRSSLAHADAPRHRARPSSSQRRSPRARASPPRGRSRPAARRLSSSGDRRRRERTSARVRSRVSARYVGPRDAPLGHVEAAKERRDHLDEFVVHHLGVLAHSGSGLARMRSSSDS